MAYMMEVHKDGKMVGIYEYSTREEAIMERDRIRNDEILGSLYMAIVYPSD